MAKRGFRSVMAALLLAFTALGVLLLQGRPALAGRDVPIKLDTLVVRFPSHRIDNRMHRISIIGSGPSCDEMESVLTRLFLDNTQIKVVEPANLQSVLAGKIIEYRTGLDPADAQALSRMFQIDHLLLFNIEQAAHDTYKFGGRYYALVNLKIIDTLNGEILFQGSSNFGVVCDDPRKYGYTQMTDSDLPRLREAAFFSVAHELKYALGGITMGLVLRPGTNVVGELAVDSVAHRAGIQKGDAIVGVNNTKVSNGQDIAAVFRAESIKQGNEIGVTIERDKKVLERKVKFPVIPLLSPNKPEQGGKELPDRDSGATYY